MSNPKYLNLTVNQTQINMNLVNILDQKKNAGLINMQNPKNLNLVANQA